MNRRKIAACVLALALCTSMTVPAFADEMPDTGIQSEVGTESETETDAETESETETEAETETDSETDTEAEVEADSEAESDTDSESETETEAVSDSEAETEEEAETEVEADTETEAEAEPETETEAETEDKEDTPEETESATEEAVDTDETDTTEDTDTAEEAEAEEDSDSDAETEEDAETEDTEEDDIEKDAANKCGANLTWLLSTNGTLTISGSGTMYNYSNYDSNRAPWYSNRQYVNRIVIESGVSYIGDYAFDNCYNVTSASIPNSVRSIGQYAFAGNSSLPSISIPDSVETISNNAFGGCISLSSVRMSNNVSIIADETFYNCQSLSSFTIPEITTTIGEYAFMESGLKSINIPYSVTTIKNGAFRNCTDLASVQFNTGAKQGIASIGLAAFSNCTSLKHITIPSNIRNVGGGCFYGCSSLESVNISRYVTDLNFTYYSGTYRYCFGGYQYNTNWYGSTFQNCTNLKTISIPGSISEIPDYAFQDCINLTSATFSEGVKSISSKAFYGCTSLRAITIPSTLNSFGSSAFTNCNKLDHIHIPNGTSFANYNYMGSLPKEPSYYYELTSRNLCPDPECPMGLTDQSIPSPVITKIEPGNHKVNLTWQAMSGATSYNVYYTSGGVTNKVNRTGTGALIKDLPNGLYTFWVTAVKGNTQTTQRNTKSAVLKNYGINVNIKPNGSPTNVTLSWSACSGASKYRIVVVDKNMNVKATRETTNTSFNWNGLGSGQQYGFYIQPFLGGVYPTFTRTDQYDKPYIKMYTASSAPTVESPKITKISTGNHKAWVYFNKVSGATSYRIYVTQNGKERLAGSTTDSKFLVTGMTNGVRATYYVKALVNGKLTTQKNTAYSTPRDGIKPGVSYSYNTATVRWSAYTGASKYQLVIVDANRNVVTSGYTTATSQQVTNIPSGKTYGFYVVPFVNGELVPFGRSHADDQANIVYIRT